MSKSFFDEYFDYIGETESPRLYHRWTAVSMVAALLGRSIYLPFGHSNLFPNHYIMLIGNPGARKGTALNPASNALKMIEFDKLAPDRLSPEKFLSEMQHLNGTVDLEGVEFETMNFSNPSEMYVVSPEFGDFIHGNLDFVRLLTNLWDCLPSYTHTKLHGKSVYINEPTVNLIGATTTQDMSQSIPIESVGQGFLSRFILVHGEQTGVKITIPEAVSQGRKDSITTVLKGIKEKMHGKIEIGSEAKDMMDRLYKNDIGIDDSRFAHYSTRRFTHLLKLSMVFTAMDLSLEMKSCHLLHANTLLNATEQRMSRALGEFGRAKNAMVTNTIMEVLKKNMKPLQIRELWKYVNQDLNRMDELIEIIKNLEGAEKIHRKEVAGKWGYLPLSKRVSRWPPDLLCTDFLTVEEL